MVVRGDRRGAGHRQPSRCLRPSNVPLPTFRGSWPREVGNVTGRPAAGMMLQAPERRPAHQQEDGDMPEAALAIDGGQTGIRAQVRRADGSAWDGLPVYESRGILTDRPLAPQIADVVGQARAASGLEFSTVSAGLSGLTDGEDLAPALLASTADFGVGTVHLVHDSVSSYLGALGDSRGAVIAAGTGSVTLAVGATDVVRIDGWGYIMGDAGSGYWLGREALVAVMRAFDGRGPATALTDVVAADFPDLAQAYVDLQRDADRIRRTASYAA